MVLSACALPLLLASVGSAQTIDLSLNVFYATPSDLNSGGTWELVAKSSNFGIASLDVRLNNINSLSVAQEQKAPRGIVNGGDQAGLILLADTQESGYRDFSIGQVPIFPLPSGKEETYFYGVGTLTNGSPMYSGQPGGTNSIGPTFTSLTNLQDSPWATGDAFSDPVWNTAATMAAGTFAAGVTPAFVAGSSGNVFVSLPPDNLSLGNIVEATSLSAIVRSNFTGQSADYNHNGLVDAADYVLWRKTFGLSVTPGSGADGSGNGMIDQPDYDLWRMHFGAAMGAGSGASLSTNAVPEPASCILFAIGTMLAIAPRRGARRAVSPKLPTRVSEKLTDV